MVGAARLECGEPTAEAGKLVRRQLGDSLGDLGVSTGSDVRLQQQSLVLGELRRGPRGDPLDKVSDPRNAVRQAACMRDRAGDDRFPQHLVLRCEPAVDRSCREASAAHDVLDAGAVVALLGENGGCCVEQFLADYVVARLGQDRLSSCHR